METEYDCDNCESKSPNKIDVNYREEKDEKEKQQLKHAFNYCLKKNFSYTNEGMKIVFETNEIEELKKKLCCLFEEHTPLIYLDKNQINYLMEDVFFVNITKNSTIIYQCVEDTKLIKRISLGNNNTNINKLCKKTSNVIEKLLKKPANEAYIILEGDVLCFDKNNNFLEYLKKGTFFGYEGPIFEKRSSTMVGNENTILAVIPDNVFVNIINPFSKFCNYLQGCIIGKDKMFHNLDKYKNTILSSINSGPIDIEYILQLYKKVNSCIHPKLNSPEVDFSAWYYSVERLPESLMETFVYNVVNTSTKVVTMDSDIFNKFIDKIDCNSRPRNIFKYLEGKGLIVCRDMETDVLDFVSNMSIHILEARKLRNLLSNPNAFKLLYSTIEDDEKALTVFKNLYPYNFTEEDSVYLKKIFKTDISTKLIKLCLHYQDYTVNIKKKSINDKLPSEYWIQNIWKKVKELLLIKTSVDEVEDLVVDIVQGSKHTLLSCISPHLFSNKDIILKWAKDNNIIYKTKSFVNDVDELVAASYYYYKDNPLKDEEKKNSFKDNGITIIEDTFSTGVKVMLINVNKLNLSKYEKDTNLKFKSASKNHLILHIGYTFGAQSSDIIKPLLMLFGSKTRSFNIIGKAGALEGNRTDILLANKVFCDKNHDMVPINCNDVDIETLEKKTNCKVHLGPMLTVAGTILQNYDLLRYYKFVNGCIGLEMEGYYYVHYIDKAIRNGLLNKDFKIRCFYYSSDLPLDPTQTLSMEGENISWNEGVGSMLAIQRYVLEKIFN